MFSTLAYYTTVFYRSFVAYTSTRLQQLGLNFGSLFLVIYVGKHSGCSQAELTEALGLDWGYSQRSITRLVEDGFLIREKVGRAYRLTLSSKGQQAFPSVTKSSSTGIRNHSLPSLPPNETSFFHC